MSHQQWEAIERTLAGLSAQDKRELVDRILQSLQAESPARSRPPAARRPGPALSEAGCDARRDAERRPDQPRSRPHPLHPMSGIFVDTGSGSPGSSPPIPITRPPRGGSTATRRR